MIKNKIIACDIGPREKLLTDGAKGLSNTELFAILLRSGTRQKSVFDLSRDLFNHRGSVRGILSSEAKELSQIHGLGPAKTAVLLAVKEICCRYLREDIFEAHSIEDPQGVYDYLQMELGENKRECFKVILLDCANHVLGESTLFEGSIDQTVVHPREVIKYAIDHYAAAIVLVHNHPSGRVEPSSADITLTKKIAKGCELMHIKLLDHLIVGKNKIYSFREEGIGFE